MRRAVLAIGLIFAAAIVAPAAMAAAGVASVTVSAQSATPLANAPKVTSDKPDYHPGEVVTLAGTGWKPGELVTIVMVVNPVTHQDVTLTAVADANGNFTNSDYMVQQSDLGVTFHVAATGAAGDIAAPFTFTDSIGTPTGIGTKSVSNTATTSMAITVTAAVAVNNTILVTLVCQDTTPTVTVTDTGGNTYTSDANITDGSNRSFVFSAPVTTALTTSSTITVHFSPSTSYISASAFQVSGLISVSRQDQTSTASGTTASMSSGTTPTTTQAGELLFGTFGVYISGTPTFTAESGWTALTSDVSTLAVYPEYRIVSATGTYAATATLSITPHDWSAAIVTYQAAASQLAFTTTPVSIVAGACSPQITVQSQDNNGNFASPYGTETIALSTSGTGGSFYSNSTCTTAITSVTIADTATSASFYWSDTTTGSPVITASGSGSFTSAPTQTETVTNNPVPAITSLSPSSATAGAAAQTLTINGTNFLTTSTATYNGVAHTVTFSSSTVISITLSAADQANAGTFPVVVTNPAPGGGASNSMNFTVNNPVPTITSLSPTSTAAGSAAQTLTINGTNFVSTSTVTYNGVAHTATFVTNVKLTIQLSTGDQATAGSYPVVVTNPTPGGGASNSMNFIVYGAAAKLAFSQQPSNTVAGASITPAITVQVEDSNGNLVTNSTASVTMAIGTNAGGGTLSGTTTVAASGGIATFSGLSINKTGTGYTLAASSTGLTGATSSTFNITPSTATQLVFTTQPGGGTGGVAWSQQPVVTVEDQFGNPVTTGTGSTASITLAISTNPSSGTLSCTTNPLAATAGVANFAGCKINFAGTAYVLSAAATGLTGTTSSAFNITVGPATQLVFGQQPTNTEDGNPITPAVTVNVEDAGGNLVTSSSATVTMAIGTNPSGGTLSGTTSVAAAGGVATFSTLSINKDGTGYTLSATSSGLTAATSSTFNITANSATQLVFTQEPSGTATAGTAFATQPKVSVEDANGNVVTTSTASITLTITSGSGTPGAALACTTNPVTAASGVATFAGCNINLVGTSYTLTATATGLTAGTSTAITITPGAPSKFVFTTEPSATATGGAPFAQQPVVSVEDVNGNVVTSGTGSNASVTLAINTGSGTLTCTTNPVTASAGVATFAGCNLNTAGSYTLKATGAYTTAVSTTIAVSVGAEAKLAFTVQPSNTAAGSTITPSVTVSVEDAGGNVVGTSADSITVAIGTNPGSSTLSGTTSVNAVNGVATFSTLSLNKVGTAYTLTATDSTTALTTATSSTFNITPGAGTQLVFTTQPGGGTGGVAWSQQPVVTVEDASGNTVTTGTNSTASITLAIGTNPSGGTLSCTANPKAAVAGVDTFAGCKITSAGTGYTLTATATGLTTATSAAFNVTVGPAAQLAFTQQPTNTVAAATITPAVTVQVEDAGGNPVTTGTGSTASIVMAIGTNPGSGTLSGTTTVSAVAGVATFNMLSINKAGTGYTLSATSSGLTTATSSAFNITAGSATQIAFTVQPTNAAQGFPISPAVVVSVEDAGGNVVITATDSITVALGANPGGSTLSGTLTVSAVSGVATFSTLSLNNTGAGYTLTATDTTNGHPVVTSSTFSVTVPQVTYIQPFNSGHGWTYTQVSCAAGTLGSCASSASTTTDCATSPCVDAAATEFLSSASQTGYFQSPTGTYTWQTLGVPANATVTSVEGGWYDHASSCSGSTTAGIQIFNSTNSTEITTPSVYAVINVSSDAGTTHALGAAAAVISGYQSSSTNITLRFNLNPATTSDFGTCTLYGDNFELLINYTSASASHGPKRRGQVIIGWNREADGSLGKMWTLNKDLPDVPQGGR